MSFGLVKIGSPSPVDSSVQVSSSIHLSANGLRGFYRSWKNTPVSGTNNYEGLINAVDWNGTAWSVVSGIRGFTGGGEKYNEGEKVFQISANGLFVAFDFTVKAPNTVEYEGIQLSWENNNFALFYSFCPADLSNPSSSNGVAITDLQNPTSGTVYKPRIIRISNNGLIRFVYYISGNNLIEITGRPSLFFPANGTYGNFLANFQISGDGNHVFVHIGGTLKLFSWDGSSWQFSPSFTSTSSVCSINFDGSIIAIQDSGAVRVYQKTGSSWAQLGGDLPDGSPWVNSTGTLVNIAQLGAGYNAPAIGGNLYGWDGSNWVWQWPTYGAISDNAQTAITVAGKGSIQRYEIQNVPPIYKGSLIASAIYAGSTSASSVYYGAQKLWP